MEYRTLNNGIKMPAQVILRWNIDRGVIVIPKSVHENRTIESLDASKVILTDEEFASLEEALNGMKVYGHRGLGGF